MNRKYINYAIFIAIVAVVGGMAVNHSRHMASLIQDMAGNDKTARIAAAKELVRGEQFMDSVTGESQETRVKVVQALEDWAMSDEQPIGIDPNDKNKTLGPKDAVRQLVGFQKDPDKPVRDRILVALLRSSARSKDNLQELVNGIKEGDVNIRRPSVLALQILGQKDAASAAPRFPQPILPLFGTTDPMQAAQTVFTTRKPEVAAMIVERTADILKREGGARASGGDVLAGLPDAREESVKTLTPLLDDKDEGVRTGATDALGKVGSKSAIPALVNAMHNGTAQVKRVAIGAIALIADPSGEDALVEALSNPDADNEARAQAAAGLGRIGSDRAIQTLRTALSDYDLKVQVAAVSALARAGKPAAPSLISLLGSKNEKPGLRARAAQALAGIDTPETSAALIAALKDPEPEVRKAAAAGLGRANSGATAALIALLGDPDGTVAATAATSLTQIGEPARSPLAQALENANPTVAYYAAQALGKQGEAAVEEISREAERAPTSHRWAITALSQIGTAKAASALKTLMATASAEDQDAAQKALQKMGSEQ